MVRCVNFTEWMLYVAENKLNGTVSLTGLLGAVKTLVKSTMRMIFSSRWAYAALTKQFSFHLLNYLLIWLMWRASFDHQEDGPLNNNKKSKSWDVRFPNDATCFFSVVNADPIAVLGFPWQMKNSGLSREQSEHPTIAPYLARGHRYTYTLFFLW